MREAIIWLGLGIVAPAVFLGLFYVITHDRGVFRREPTFSEVAARAELAMRELARGFGALAPAAARAAKAMSEVGMKIAKEDERRRRR